MERVMFAAAESPQPAFGAARGLAGPPPPVAAGAFANQAATIQVRKTFPETWLWLNLTVPMEDGRQAK